MKTIVIAQHHGVFLTINSLKELGIDDVTILIPGSQVNKYNKMYDDNPTNLEFCVFQNYDKLISQYLRKNNLNYKVFVVDDFNIANTLVSTMRVIADLGHNEIVCCMLSGSLAIKDYRPFVRDALMFKTFGMCYSRVYQTHNQLSMYHMIGLRQNDPSLDLNFFVVDMTKITQKELELNDAQILSDASKKKLMMALPREFNGKDDPLIGTAISARQTVTHNLKIQSGFIVNLWNKSIKSNDGLKSEEMYGYPLNLYSKYSSNLNGFLPSSTLKKIKVNGDETEKLTSGLYGCLDIIDL